MISKYHFIVYKTLMSVMGKYPRPSRIPVLGMHSYSSGFKCPPKVHEGMDHNW
jgi:hypothetical protein